MNVEPLKITNSERLLLIFSGWASDAHLFENLVLDGYDLIIVSDYTNFNPRELNLDKYKEICVIGWSFGVPHAAEFLASNPRLPLTLSIAVNGTPLPIDDNSGIPVDIFTGTLENLDERNLQKFYRRMCPDSSTYNRIKELIPNRGIAELKDELAAIAKRSFEKSASFKWDIAFVGSDDRIIPPLNQHNAWRNNALTIIEDKSAHLPDFQKIINKFLVNKKLVAQRFHKVADCYGLNAVVQKRMTGILADKLTGEICNPPCRIIEFGAGRGEFTLEYIPKISHQNLSLELWDISHVSPQLPGQHIIGDAELLIKNEPDESSDIICGSATIQWFNNPLRFIRDCQRVLRPGGILAFSTFAPSNFREITQITGSLPLISIEKWESELEKIGFHTVVDSEERTIEFENPYQLLKHLKLTGVNALHSSDHSAISAARKIIDAGICTLTYTPVYLIARKV